MDELTSRAPTANSLFRNILRIKPLSSIFCVDNQPHCSANLNHSNILAKEYEK